MTEPAGDIPLRGSAHDRRVTELLDANNREVERRRAAKAEVRHLRECLLSRLGEPDGEEAVARWLRHRGFVVNRPTQDERASHIPFPNMKEANQ